MPDSKGNDVRPRDEDFSIDTEASYYRNDELKKTDHREKPWVIAAILGCGVVLAAASILVYHSFKQNQRTIVTTAESTAPQEPSKDTVTEIPTSDEDDSTTGISEVTQQADSAEDTVSSVTEESAEPTEPEESAEPTEPEESVEDPASPEEPEGDTEDSDPSELSYQDVELDAITYRVEDGIATLIRCRASESRIEFPAKIYGYPVVGVDDDAFRGLATVSLIVIPEGVDWISHNAFEDCPNLLQVVIPDSVDGISDDAFGSNLGVTIQSSRGSYAHNFAINKGMNWIEKS